ncbi:MAG TPA: TonB-dependent receptor [Longimicrobiales bacterium]
MGRMSGHRNRAAALGAAAVFVMAGGVAAQAPGARDTALTLDEVVVTAERVRAPLVSSIASVSVLTASQLEQAPQLTLADALRRVPGFAVLGTDGLGYDPQIAVRGFYGGGEAEYVVVLVDGIPVNDVQSGLVAWDAIPLGAVERIEIVRGGASSLWGDAAIGGVINVITRGAGASGVRWSVAGGSAGTWRGGASVRGTVLGRGVTAFGGFDRTDGFRRHAERIAGRAGATVALAAGPTGSLRLSAASHWREFDEPGPVLDANLATDRVASDVFYRFDATEDRLHRLSLDGERVLGPRARLSASIGGELRDRDVVGTVVLAPGFADTQARELGTGRAVANAVLSIEGTGLPVEDRLTIGVDASYGTVDSKYFGIVTGDAAAYLASSGARGELAASGSADRLGGAVFAQYTLAPASPVRVSLGVRVDWLRDAYEPATTESGAAQEASHRAVSPRVGVNVRYAEGAHHVGHVYASAGRSFKAPTLDQLFDQRRMPVPFPPFAVSLSNGELEPQRGTSVEAGLYHQAELVPGVLTGELSVSAYQMDMEDEIDFDVATLRYVNIGRSRHRGIEAGLGVRVLERGSAFLNYTQQRAVARGGEMDGKQLKAIPRHVVTGGFSLTPVGRLETGVLMSHTRGAYLDDANTAEIPAYTRVDARVSYPIAGGVRVYADVRNLFDAEYSTTGFPDPAGTGAAYYYPAAGRMLEIGFRSR